MASFVDYNEQLLKYRQATKEGFVDANEDPKKAIDPVEITPPNKEGLDRNINNLIEHEKTNLSTPELREFGTGLDYDTYSVDDLTDEEITTRTIINEDNEETQEEIIGPSRQKLRATLAATHDLTMTPGLDLNSYSVDDLTDESIIPPEVDEETGEIVVPEKIGTGRQKLRSTISVPEESPNIASGYGTANKKTQQVVNLDGEEGVYQPVGYGIEGIGEVIKRAVTPFGHANRYEKIESNDLTEYKTRTESSITGNQLQMFLYTLVPFVLGQAAEGINALQREVSDVIDDPTALAGQLGTVKNVFFLANYLSYFTIKEMASHLLATPFTLGYLASFGFALKDEISSVKWSTTSLKTKTLAKSWDINELGKNLVSAGGPKTLKEMYADIYSDVFKDLKTTGSEFRDYLTRIFSGGENTSKQAGVMLNYQKILEEFRDEIRTIINKHNNLYRIQKDFFEFGGSSEILVGSENKDSNLDTFFGGDKRYVSRKTEQMTLMKPGTIGTPNSLISNYKAVLNSENFKVIAQKIYAYVLGDKTYSSDKKRTEKILNDAMNMLKQEDELLELKRTENLIKDGKYTLDISDFIDILKTAMPTKVENNEPGVDSGNLKNNAAAERTRREKISTQLTNIKTSQTKVLDDIKSSLKNQHAVGYVYVYPSRTEGFSTFKIPFQFNPILNDAGQAARYDAMNMLHRQGQAFSYIQTEGQTLTLETEYLMLSDGKENEGTDPRKKHDPSSFINPQDAFYKFWTPKVVQTVELALRSLVLPIAQNSSNGDIMFHKPPMVKIVMGRGHDMSPIDTRTDNNLYRMLMYPLKDGKHYHKTYIITKVAIIREAETPYYINNDGTQVIDTHGFKVSMDLTEIDHNYVGVAPDFKNFYDVYKTEVKNFEPAAK
jgi:hypothetical protein